MKLSAPPRRYVNPTTGAITSRPPAPLDRRHDPHLRRVQALLKRMAKR